MSKEDLSAKPHDSMTINGPTCGTSMSKAPKVVNMYLFHLYFEVRL